MAKTPSTRTKKKNGKYAISSPPLGYTLYGSLGERIGTWFDSDGPLPQTILVTTVEHVEAIRGATLCKPEAVPERIKAVLARYERRRIL